MLVVDADVVRATARHDVAGYPVTRTDYLNPEGAPGLPHAFLVEQHAGSVIRAHFHEVAQFQVFVRGSGRLARRPLSPLVVHYTDAYTGYGPIDAGADGIAYLTLRARHDVGAWHLPESNQHLRQRERSPRHRSGVTQLHPTRPWRSSGDPGPEVLFADPDGLASAVLDVPPGSGSPPWWDRSEGPGPRYAVVASGSVVVDGSSLGPESVVFVDRDEPAPTLVAGPEGARLALLRFPVPTG